MNKKFIVFGLIAVSACALAGGALSFNPNFTAAFAGSTCDDGHNGYHYTAVEATYENSGNKEFWTCCTCHQQFLAQPEGTFVDQDLTAAIGGFDSTHIAYSAQLTRDSAQVRDNYNVVVDDVKDLLYKDAIEHTIGTTKVKTLWDNEKVYLFVELGSETSSFVVEFGEEAAVTLTTNKELVYDVAGLAADTIVPVTFEETNTSGTITYTNLIKATLNGNNNAENPRKLFEAKQISDETVLSADGVKDEAYNAATAIAINCVSEGTSDTTGTAYMLWNNTYLYVFIEVNDNDLDKTSNPWSEWRYEYDSVEFYLVTGQTLPTSSSYWGWDNANTANSLRPSGNYCGELAMIRRPGDPGCTFFGTHWMWDFGNVFGQSVASGSVAGDTSYTVEFAIPWMDTSVEAGAPNISFKNVENKVNQIIDFSININDGEGSHKGEVCTNYGNHNITRHSINAHMLDQLKLVA